MLFGKRPPSSTIHFNSLGNVSTTMVFTLAVSPTRYRYYAGLSPWQVQTSLGGLALASPEDPFLPGRFSSLPQQSNFSLNHHQTHGYTTDLLTSGLISIASVIPSFISRNTLPMLTLCYNQMMSNYSCQPFQQSITACHPAVFHSKVNASNNVFQNTCQWYRWQSFWQIHFFLWFQLLLTVEDNDCLL